MNIKPWHTVLFFAVCLIAGASIMAARRGTKTGTKQVSSSATVAKVGDWDTFEDETLKFQHPHAFKISAHNVRTGKGYLAFQYDDSFIGNLFINYPRNKERRSLRQIFKENQKTFQEDPASEPRELKLPKKDCLIYHTQKSYYATCYNRRSDFFEVQGEKNYQNRPDRDSNAVIAKNFERLLRSIEFK